jgi:CheY-like chemotaxis protein
MGRDALALKILVIEDDGDTVEALRLLLELAGHDVATADSGESGVEQARRFRPDAVLCDLALPGSLDGYAVARALRGESALRATRLVALSGYDEDGGSSAEAGFDVHLTKPIDPDGLGSLLAAWERQA